MKKLFPVLIVLSFFIGVTACSGGSKSETKEKVEDVKEDIKDKAEDVGDNVEDAAEDAGEEMEEVGEDVEESLEGNK